MLKEKELIGKLESEYSDYMYEKHNIPKPYFQNVESVKAILLGSNPVAVGEMSGDEYVFNLGGFNKDIGGGPIFGNIYNNMDAVSLDIMDIYAQNLCKNYFVNLSVHDDKWIEIAGLWAEVLKEELDTLFSKNIPVLVTAPWILKPLVKEVKESKYYYENKEFISQADNKLGRILIPFFRQRDFSLLNDEWKEYRDKIKYRFE